MIRHRKKLSRRYLGRIRTRTGTDVIEIVVHKKRLHNKRHKRRSYQSGFSF